MDNEKYTNDVQELHKKIIKIALKSSYATMVKDYDDLIAHDGIIHS